jgi:hypothetical protein
MSQDPFINKAKASGIIALDLLDYKPTTEIVELDIKDHLFMGMIVKEKEFKESIAATDFSHTTEKQWESSVLRMRSFRRGPICLLWKSFLRMLYM